MSEPSRLRGSRGIATWALATVALLRFVSGAAAESLVKGVGAIGITVFDMDRSVGFYGSVLGFEKVSDVEVWGSEYERLQGVFGLRMRVVRMRLGHESIELTEYLTPSVPCPRTRAATTGGSSTWRSS